MTNTINNNKTPSVLITIITLIKSAVTQLVAQSKSYRFISINRVLILGQEVVKFSTEQIKYFLRNTRMYDGGGAGCGV